MARRRDARRAVVGRLRRCWSPSLVLVVAARRPARRRRTATTSARPLARHRTPRRPSRRPPRSPCRRSRRHGRSAGPRRSPTGRGPRPGAGTPRAATRCATRDLGRHVPSPSVDALGRPTRCSTDGRRPASCRPRRLKLLTTTAALRGARPRPHLRHPRRRAAGGRIVLVGGGDPFLAGQQPTDRPEPGRRRPADPGPRDRRGPAAAAASHAVRLGYDDLAVHRPGGRADWPAATCPTTWSAPITALWVDEGRDPDGTGPRARPRGHARPRRSPRASRKHGRRRSRAPPRERSRAGRRAGGRAGDEPAAGRDRRAASCEYSDNEGAEVLGHQVGLAVERPRVVRRRGARGAARRCSELGVDLRRRQAPRRQRAVARRPARPATPCRRAPARRGRRPPRAPAGRHRAAGGRRSTGSLAYRFATARARARPGARQDRHPHRHQRPGRAGHRPTTAHAVVFVADRRPDRRSLDTLDARAGPRRPRRRPRRPAPADAA